MRAKSRDALEKGRKIHDTRRNDDRTETETLVPRKGAGVEKPDRNVERENHQTEGHRQSKKVEEAG